MPQLFNHPTFHAGESLESQLDNNKGLGLDILHIINEVTINDKNWYV